MSQSIPVFTKISSSMALDNMFFQPELPHSVYSGGDSDIYTDFSDYQTLSNQDILTKIESGENSGLVCLAKYPRCQRFYPVEETLGDFCSLFNNMDMIFGEFCSGKIFDLINPLILDNNQKQTMHIAKSSSGKYYLIKSDHFHQTYSWDELVFEEGFIQLYLGSSIQEKITYAIRSIENNISKSESIQMLFFQNSRKLNKKHINFPEQDLTIEPNGFIEVSYYRTDGSKYVIWCDQNKMFGWYPITESDNDDWINAFR